MAMAMSTALPKACDQDLQLILRERHAGSTLIMNMPLSLLPSHSFEEGDGSVIDLPNIASNMAKLARHAAIASQEFLFEDGKAPFSNCHASSIVELGLAAFMAAYYGGTYVGYGDVAIWTSRLEAGHWKPPVLVTENRMCLFGIQSSSKCPTENYSYSTKSVKKSKSTSLWYYMEWFYEDIV